MNPEEQDFDSLRKLLALKKHELPPPRYFSELPGRIWMRMERETEPVSIWEKFFPNFNLKPAFAYSFGLLACGTLAAGLGYTLRNQSSQALSAPRQKDAPMLASQEPAYMTLSNSTDMAEVATNLDTQPLPSLFERVQIKYSPASFSPVQ